MKPYFTVKRSEWRRMPKKTKLALAEMAKAALKQFSAPAKRSTIKRGQEQEKGR